MRVGVRVAVAEGVAVRVGVRVGVGVGVDVGVGVAVASGTTWITEGPLKICPAVLKILHRKLKPSNVSGVSEIDSRFPCIEGISTKFAPPGSRN